MASPLPRFERLPCPSVQLVHELPGGDWHIDWLIARDGEGGEPLISFRAARRLDKLQPGDSIAIQRIADHRSAYLDYEGPVSNDRGIVTRVARGELVEVELSPHDQAFAMRIRWQGRIHRDIVQRLKLARAESDQWSVTCVAIHEAPAAAAAGIAQEES